VKVKSRMACPVRQKDGSWKVITKEFEEDIPDLGRHRLICNKCGFSSYPACKEWCPVEQSTLAKEKEKSTES